MSYLTQAQLYGDGTFQQRSASAATEQAAQPHSAPIDVALARDVQRGNGDQLLAFARLNAAGPGIADKVAQPDGTIDQSQVTDADLLSLTQANWPVVAGLYYAADGSPL